ncbi:hypothetical protein [Anaerosacchariphilus polymeriproducens]|uniref:Pilus assembly protein PilM n=1 Tax=Anaerosacchariphilus polymeriproducens TaxID=1812858 RepID=A0A371AQL2_9FIRM|nr:hypothetical protein [Anaerosacchariphilus polymeriproducens]RDU21848.1 hypothetical protein DWV06_17855 [Anaerosacchariphilus polymeriproducens]
MASRVLSIEIGYSLTKVVEMDYNIKNPKIYKCFDFETPKGVLEDGVVTPSQEFRDSYVLACEKNEIKTKKVVFNVISSRIANREVTIPAVKSNKIAELLRANASEYFPVDVSKYCLAHNILEELGNKKDGKQYKLSVLAIPEELVFSYYKLAELCGLTVEALDYTGNSVLQAVKGGFETGTHLLVKLEENSSMLTVLNKGNVVLQRSIAYGISTAVNTLRETNAFGQNLTFSDAVTVLRRETCIWSQLGENFDYDYIEGEEPQETVIARGKITDSLNDLIRNIARIIDYHNSRSSEIPIEKISLIGVGADVSGLSRLITNELGIKVNVLKQVQNAVLTKAVQAEREVSISQYIACIGATLKPVEINANSKGAKGKKGGKSSFISKEKAEASQSMKEPIILVMVAVLIAGGLVGYPIIKKLSLQAAKDKLQSQIESLMPVQDTYNNYLSAKADFEELQAMYDSTTNPNENMLSFLEELEDKMPTSINVISFTASEEGVEMTMNVDSKPAAAKVLVQLRTFHSLASVETTELKTVEDETKKKTLEFTVTCLYKINTAAAQTPDNQTPATQN